MQGLKGLYIEAASVEGNVGHLDDGEKGCFEQVVA